MLGALRLEAELVAASPADFIAKAQALAAAPARLAELRAGLRDRVAASPLCDARLKARHMERACRALWTRWCAGKHRPPSNIDLVDRLIENAGHA